MTGRGAGVAGREDAVPTCVGVTGGDPGVTEGRWEDKWGEMRAVVARGVPPPT